MCEINYVKLYVKIALQGCFVGVGDSDLPPHIQRRVNVTHMHASDKQNVKWVKLIM
jgi:hypothetical protein